MKAFFLVLFGGLGIILIAFSLHVFGPRVVHFVDNISWSRMSFADVNSSVDPISRIRYSALEEENIINEATNALPKNTSSDITAQAYIVRDISENKVIDSKNSNKLLPIASLTKLVTAVVARELIPSASRIAISQKVINTYGNTAGLADGETFTAHDLLYPLLMVSSNDAAEAYADFFGRKEFIQSMNNFTQSIGAYRTYFADPSGLDPRNASTVTDISIIVDWIRTHDPEILDITRLKNMTIRNHTWDNPAHFLSLSYYIGGKNGYLPESKLTSASLFQLGPHSDEYAVVLLGSVERDADTLFLIKKIQH